MSSTVYMNVHVDAQYPSSQFDVRPVVMLDVPR